MHTKSRMYQWLQEASLAQWSSCSPFKSGVVGSTAGFSSLSDETLNRGPMTIFQDKLLTRTDCDETGDYVVPYVFKSKGPSLQT